MKKPEVTLEISELQFLVIYEFLYNTKLGDRNKFESAISDLMQEFEESGVDIVANMIRKRYGKVDIGVLATQEDGMEFHLN